jgi:hypothetical protein
MEDFRRSRAITIKHRGAGPASGSGQCRFKSEVDYYLISVSASAIISVEPVCIAQSRIAGINTR